MTHEIHLNRRECVHLAEEDWQARTECGRIIPLTAIRILWNGKESGVCRICLRRIWGR